MSTIHMIRHGQASFGAEDYDKLSDLGERQASVLALYLEKVETRFDIIYTGTLKRQIDTAGHYLRVIGEKGKPIPKVIRSSAFNEYDSKKVLMELIPVMEKDDSKFAVDVKTIFNDKASFQRVFEAVMIRWAEGGDTLAGVETWKSFRSRVIKGLDELMEEHGRGKNIAVFTSGGPIGVAVGKGLNLTKVGILGVTWQIVNGSVSSFKCTRDRFMLSTFNEHMFFKERGKEKMVTYR